MADIGTVILNNAWEGYNASLLAYGQTGAGKTLGNSIGLQTNQGLPKFHSPKNKHNVRGVERGNRTQETNVAIYDGILMGRQVGEGCHISS